MGEIKFQICGVEPVSEPAAGRWKSGAGSLNFLDGYKNLCALRERQ